MNDDIFLVNLLTAANIESLTKETIKKIGLEFMAPIDIPIQDEKISAAINSIIVDAGNKEIK